LDLGFADAVLAVRRGNAAPDDAVVRTLHHAMRAVDVRHPLTLIKLRLRAAFDAVDGDEGGAVVLVGHGALIADEGALHVQAVSITKPKYLFRFSL